MRRTNFERETFETLHSLEIDLFFLLDLYVLYCVLCIERFELEKNGTGGRHCFGRNSTKVSSCI